MDQLIAAKPLTYATRRLKAGDAFEAPRAHARVLVAIGKARLAEAVEQPKRRGRPPGSGKHQVIPASEVVQVQDVASLATVQPMETDT